MDDTQTLTTTARSVAEVSTPQPARYLTQLCKHFEHKLAVTHGDGSGNIAFASGRCQLWAEPGVLTLTVEAADAPSLAQLEDVVARHLLRFAFREDMQINWHPG